MVAAFPISADGATAGEAVEILTVDRPPGQPNNHIGGSLPFGPDGYLYVGTGDGGAGAFLAPDSTSFYGKVLRIEPDPFNGGYTSPEGNTVDGPDALPELWTVGMRKPSASTSTARSGTSGSPTWARNRSRRSTASASTRRSARTSTALRG